MDDTKTIAAAIEEYLQHLVAENRSPHTVAAYRRDLSTFARFAERQRLRTLPDATPADLTAFMAARDVRYDAIGHRRAPASVNRYRRPEGAARVRRGTLARGSEPHAHPALPEAPSTAAGHSRRS
jgi:hypothetical protein